MAKRWVGLVAAKESVVMVDATIPDNDSEPIQINADDTWRVQKGDRPPAYSVLHQQCADYMSDHGIDAAFVKASAVSGRGGATLGNLQSAEVRGVVIAAAASKCRTSCLSKAVISKTYGKKKVDEYVADDAFWDGQTEGKKLRKLSREAAMLVISARNANA